MLAIHELALADLVGSLVRSLAAIMFISLFRSVIFSPRTIGATRKKKLRHSACVCVLAGEVFAEQLNTIIKCYFRATNAYKSITLRAQSVLLIVP